MDLTANAMAKANRNTFQATYCSRRSDVNGERKSIFAKRAQ
jgi:hypothetical protein